MRNLNCLKLKLSNGIAINDDLKLKKRETKKFNRNSIDEINDIKDEKLKNLTWELAKNPKETTSKNAKCKLFKTEIERKIKDSMSADAVKVKMVGCCADQKRRKRKCKIQKSCI